MGYVRVFVQESPHHTPNVFPTKWYANLLNSPPPPRKINSHQAVHPPPSRLYRAIDSPHEHRYQRFLRTEQLPLLRNRLNPLGFHFIFRHSLPGVWVWGQRERILSICEEKKNEMHHCWSPVGIWWKVHGEKRLSAHCGKNMLQDK